MSVRVKKNDKIKILTGKDTGKSGKVLLVDIKKGIVIVEGLNVVKKTKHPDQKSQKGGIIDIEAPIRVSNVMVICPKCGKTMRVKKKELDDGKRVRICGKCGEMLDRD